mmetsp:Transcript_53897/g.99600  ORF Transcript_53897/g.99600 Transcript_53897/m.99600 type:complete len:206 (+) Transcript_53897:850-1467(+)
MACTPFLVGLAILERLQKVTHAKLCPSTSRRLAWVPHFVLIISSLFFIITSGLILILSGLVRIIFSLLFLLIGVVSASLRFASFDHLPETPYLFKSASHHLPRPVWRPSPERHVAAPPELCEGLLQEGWPQARMIVAKIRENGTHTVDTWQEVIDHNILPSLLDVIEPNGVLPICSELIILKQIADVSRKIGNCSDGSQKPAITE